MQKQSPGTCRLGAKTRLWAGDLSQTLADEHNEDSSHCRIRPLGEVCCGRLNVAESSAFSWMQHSRIWANSIVHRAVGEPGPKARNVAICCAQHMATYVALRTMLRLVPGAVEDRVACLLRAALGSVAIAIAKS
jgi:hypothetical protein